MSNSIDGKRVAEIWMPDDSVCKPFAGGQMVFHTESCSEHDHSEWICSYDSEGIEVVRHNVRFVAAIVWAKEG